MNSEEEYKDANFYFVWPTQVMVGEAQSTNSLTLDMNWRTATHYWVFFLKLIFGAEKLFLLGNKAMNQ